jgi:hypothetical protein
LEQKKLKKLARLEHRVLSGDGQPINVAQLSSDLADFAVDRLAGLTEEEFEHAFDTLCGFNSPELSEEARSERVFRQRRLSLGYKVTPEFVEKINSFRRSLADDTITRSLVQSEISQRVRRFADFTLKALPGNDNTETTTPLQAFLIVYSVASDDGLATDDWELQRIIQSVHQSKIKRFGYYPRSEFAYGVNGFIYSSPIDLVLNGKGLDGILNILDERSTVK